MSTDRDVTSVVRAWLEEGVTAMPDRVLDSVMEQLPATHQRRAQRPAWRLNTMSTLRLAAIAAALSVVAVVFGIVPRTVGPGTTNPTGSPSPIVSPALLPTACPSGTPLPSGTIATVAGNGIQFHSGDGGQATAAGINGPYATVAADATGALYITDSTSRLVRRVGTDGVISTFVPADKFGTWSFPMGLAFDPAGDLYVADPGSLQAPYIRKVDPAGTMTTIAGVGVVGSTGNDGPALSAEIEAAQITVGPQGNLYFDDINGFRTIDTAGVIHAFAGTGVAGFSGDGGPAVDAEIGLSEPVTLGVAADAAGNVYLGDPSNYRIRKVDAAGIIATVAGTGVAGYSGDGGPAVRATISKLAGLAVDPAGDVYFADTGNNVVRKIDTTGVITTVAGTGVAGFSGDCGPAMSAQLSEPAAIAVHDGILYVVDNNRIRMVVP
jgi:hypothetical protein